MTSFKYLGATLCKDGTCSPEVCIRTVSEMAAMARLNRIWWCDTISFANKFKLYNTYILRYGSETWTLLADSEKGIQPLKTKCIRKLTCTSYLEHKTNNWVQSKINFLLSSHEPLLATVKRWKHGWFGQVTRIDSLPKTILQGTSKGGKHCGWQRKCWIDNIKK